MARPKGLPKTGGRKAGTPNKATGEIRALAQEYTEAAVRVLAEIMVSKDAPPAARVSAASALLDRGHGKPPQSITGANDTPLIPPSTATPDRVAAVFLALTERLPRARIEHSKDDDGQDG
jgi:hypothetical protein